MQNLLNNRINLVLTNEKLVRINELLTQLTQELDFTIGLTADERRTLPKISKSNKLFVQDTVTAVKENESILPVYIKKEFIENDLTLFLQTEPLLVVLETLYYKLRDTQMLAGSEAYGTALMIYRMFKAAAEAGLPGMQAVYSSLRERFAVQTSNETAPEEVTGTEEE